MQRLLLLLDLQMLQFIIIKIEMAVVGIGARLEHSTEEHIYISDMEKAVKMLLEIFKLSAN